MRRLETYQKHIAIFTGTLVLFAIYILLIPPSQQTTRTTHNLSRQLSPIEPDITTATSPPTTDVVCMVRNYNSNNRFINSVPGTWDKLTQKCRIKEDPDINPPFFEKTKEQILNISNDFKWIPNLIAIDQNLIVGGTTVDRKPLFICTEHEDTKMYSYVNPTTNKCDLPTKSIDTYKVLAENSPSSLSIPASLQLPSPPTTINPYGI